MDKFDYVALTNEVVRRNINLFGTFDVWTKGAFALSNLGEDGRVLFKKISQLSDKYKENENERKFTNALHTANKIGIASFIYMCQQKGIDTNKFYLKDAREGEMFIAKARNELVEKPPAYVDISGQYVDNSLDKHQESDFILFLKGLMNDVDKVEKAITAYRIGVTKLHHTIFWYIDVEGKVCYGKIMAYKPDGHRDHEVVPQSIPKMLEMQGVLSQNYQIKQVLFGEHLLNEPRYKDSLVGIVESEKTAVVCSMCVDNVLWLATGSLYNLQEERLQSVKERHVVLYPDTDKKSNPFTRWRRVAESLNAKGWHIQVSEYLEKVTTQEQKQHKVDLADLLIADLQANACLLEDK